MIRQSDLGAPSSASTILDRFRLLIAELLRRLAAHTPRRLRRFALSSQNRIVRRWPRMSGWLADSPAAEKGSPKAVAENGVIERPQEAVETETLIAALRDPSAEVAVAAAEALARRPPALAVPALRTVVENKDGYFCPSTRVAAVHALKSLLPPGQGGLVADAVRDSDASVSVAAIAALVERNDDESADILLGLLEDSTGFYVALTRRAAALGLAHLRPGHSGRVTALLQNESDPEVRHALGAG